MTTHYIDITLQPDPDFTAAHLMGALFSKFHRRLAALDRDDIGVSFPKHRLKPRDIGNALRLHGEAPALNALMADPWLRGMREHAVIGPVSDAPTSAMHRIVRRRQFKTNAERLRRRRMRRHNESAETTRERIPDNVERRVSLPFVQVRSASTGQPFSLFVEHGLDEGKPKTGRFNSYGLSTEATVPWF